MVVHPLQRRDRDGEEGKGRWMDGQREREREVSVSSTLLQVGVHKPL